MKYIELFAGCGGLSLGLESAGFKLLFANELSSMASETYVHNFFNEKLDQTPLFGNYPKHTYWLNSKFDISQMSLRLRENPKETPELGKGFNDLSLNDTDIENSMLVGNIIDLNKYLSNKSNSKLLKKIQDGFGNGGVDLISGGPPCQSFSMAGLRQHGNDRNQLPWEFAKFVELVQPKIAMLENVTGILRPFNIDGEKYYAWFEVAKAFSSIGYVPVCVHVNAKYAGVAQNRPRFIMIAIKECEFQKLKSNTTNEISLGIFSNSEDFYQKIKDGDGVKYGDLECYDIENSKEIFSNSFLSPLIKYQKDQWRTVCDAIDDLRLNGGKKSAYVKQINQDLTIDNKTKGKKIHNNDLRANSEIVRMRFRLYQLLNKTSIESRGEVNKFLRDPFSDTLKHKTIEEMFKFDYLGKDEVDIRFSNSEALIKYLSLLKTRKRSQKALVSNRSAPAALSIPDDTCHYHHNELRTLTVREMARIQSFPDWFQFKSKVTTGGIMRRFEVPQYTQVGNAVPPLFGLALGKVVSGLINDINKNAI